MAVMRSIEAIFVDQQPITNNKKPLTNNQSAISILRSKGYPIGDLFAPHSTGRPDPGCCGQGAPRPGNRSAVGLVPHSGPDGAQGSARRLAGLVSDGGLRGGKVARATCRSGAGL